MDIFFKLPNKIKLIKMTKAHNNIVKALTKIKMK